MSYELDLPSILGSIHSVSHVSMLKKCVGDPSLFIPLESVGILDFISYEKVLVKILNRQVCCVRTNVVASVKVLWRNHNVEGDTWETKEAMRSKYPFLLLVLDNHS